MSPKANLASSPPSLPIVRQPSPLSFSVTSDERSLPPSPGSHHASLADSSACSSIPPNLDTLANPSGPSRPLAPRAFSSSSAPRHTDGPIPIAPLPDSILYRSTLTHLENSSTNLKRLSKSVLSHSSLLISALEAVDKAEEEFLSALGELGRYLESGFGVQGGLWADDGVRKIRKEKWVGQREAVRGMVEQGVSQVKGDLKRWGLAGGGSHARFERATKQYYDQTSAYLSHSDPSAPISHSMSATSTSSHSRQTSPTAVESEQSARTAAFDLARYSHHSTLLYAVPPSSISCLDLLVNIYNWVGGVLGENPTRKESIGGMDEAFGSTPSLILQTPKQKSSPPTATNRLKDEVAQSLCKLAGIRVDLLDGWAKRNDQTTRLEDEAHRLLVVSENKATSGSVGSRAHDKPLSPTIPFSSTPISSSAVGYKKNGRMHKLHKSVGGKLRDLLSSGGSSRDLNGIISSGRNGYLGGDRSNRNSFDVSVLSGRKEMMRDDVGEVELPLPAMPSSAPSGPTIRVVSRPVTADPLPYRRPSLQSRHSIQITPDPNTPFLVDPDLFPLPALSSNKISPPKIDGALRRSSRSDEGAGSLNGSRGNGGMILDHEDNRENVERKKEGVLWGAGTWEEVGKGGKMKWEKYWVVLDHSSIYEYRDTDFDRPEGAHAVIDLKFASVREGRGTDRRFVFEIVTPTQGRRLYQATSDSEMKQWIYAICNAIESVIQGTSSVRTFDTSKLRTLSGAYDDHAVPLRQKLGFPIPGIPPRSGLGLGGLPTIPGSPSRRSMPPPSRLEEPGPGHPRERQTSFKKALRQSAEMAGEKWKDVLLSPRSPDGNGKQGFLAPHSGLRSSSSHSAISSAGGRYPSPPPPKSDGSHDSQPTQSKISDTGDQSGVGDTSWYEVDADGEIEKRVMEMAGLGIGLSPNNSPNNVDRRVRSEGRGVLGSTAGGVRDVGEEMTRSKSAEVPSQERKGRKLDMETLRWVAGLPGNTVCADCGKSTKASRWATINLRDTPMVMFICIRCCGIHRSFGTHISKPRSVDLDTWTQESISLALDWGNQRGNQLWEAVLPPSDKLREGDISEFVRLKYVEGKWLSDEMRARYKLGPRAGVVVGLALGEPGSGAITGVAR